MQHFTERVIAITRRIPRGRVTTYGLIAAAAGNYGGARQVARILHSSSDKYKLPWHRVVNVKGEISPRRSMGHITQRNLLEQEAVFIEAGRINLEKFLWLPGRE